MDWLLPGDFRTSALVWVMPLEWLYVRSGWSRRSSAAVSLVNIACFQDSIAASTSAFGSAALSDAAVATRRSHLSIGFQLNAVRPSGIKGTCPGRPIGVELGELR